MLIVTEKQTWKNYLHGRKFMAFHLQQEEKGRSISKIKEIYLGTFF